ncbi:TPA: coenzyme F420-0:L-glutamate ligase, partial [Candidatus Bathyarchaeota archaeon]|nr:coenzyme F420-0:L-glutamate ligase [Candidatus Bathyarchaeota archaeon]
MKLVELRPIKTKIIAPGDNLTDVILEGLREEGLKLTDGDVLLIASKAVSAAEGMFIKLSDVSPSLEAKRLAKEVTLDERHVELILRHSEKIYG